MRASLRAKYLAVDGARRVLHGGNDGTFAPDAVAVEVHGAGRQLVRVRQWPASSRRGPVRRSATRSGTR